MGRVEAKEDGGHGRWSRHVFRVGRGGRQSQALWLGTFHDDTARFAAEKGLLDALLFTQTIFIVLIVDGDGRLLIHGRDNAQLPEFFGQRDWPLIRWALLDDAGTNAVPDPNHGRADVVPGGGAIA